MVAVSASVNLPLHHKVQKFSSGTGSPGWSRKKGHNMVVLCVVLQGSSTDMFFDVWHVSSSYEKFSREQLITTLENSYLSR